MFCKKCGKELEEGQLFCPDCGQKVDEEINEEKKIQKQNNFWWGVLGFFIPLVGLILFIVWNNDENNKGKGKAAGIGALISVCAGVAITLIRYIIVIIIAVISAANNPELTTLLSLFLL